MGEDDECGVCGVPLDGLTADANLIADWQHCDGCLDTLLRPLRLDEVWEGHIRAWVRREWRAALDAPEGAR